MAPSEYLSHHPLIVDTKTEFMGDITQTTVDFSYHRCLWLISGVYGQLNTF